MITDFALLILDKKGEILSSDGLSYNTGAISIYNTFTEDELDLTFRLVPAYACGVGKMKVNIIETTLLDEKMEISLTDGGSKRVTLYPSLKKTLDLKYKLPEFKIPADANYYGKLYFNSLDDEKEIAKLPILIKQ